MIVGCLAMFFIGAKIVLAKTGEIVATEVGSIGGWVTRTRFDREFLAFTSIPYAEPPINQLRFASPVPKKAWNGTYWADRIGPQCLQVSGSEYLGSEDCLYLNVYTPTTEPEEPLPVMVFIHGGSFLNGNGSYDYISPNFLLDKDIVLVAMNYRMGIFGFLSTGDLAAPGNFGLKDQLLALRWVQRNIRNFGGDPARVTLFGQSAGGVSVNLHALSDKSKDLFQQYIIESGSVLFPWAFKANPDYSSLAFRVASKYDCPQNSTSELVDCLRGLSTDELLDTDDALGILTTVSSITWTPTNEPESDDAFITESPTKLIEKNKMKDAPFITGVVKDEALLITTSFYSSSLLLYLIRPFLRVLILYVMTHFYNIPLFRAWNASKVVKQFYFGNHLTLDNDLFFRQLTTYATDEVFFYPQIEMLKKLSAVNENFFYFYNFDYRGVFSYTSQYLGGDNTDIGVCHGDDTIYLFPQSSWEFGLPENATQSEEDQKIIDVVVDAWTSFATTGVPTSSKFDEPNFWQPYQSNTSYLKIGNYSNGSISLMNSFYPERMSFWKEEMTKFYKIFF